MNMRSSARILKIGQWLLAVGAMALLMANASHAQIYKWVDANGRTHYSEQKDDAGGVKTEELKLKSQPTTSQQTNLSSEYWQQQERLFQQRQALKARADPPAARRPKSLSDGKEDSSDKSRCALARDVLSGAVVHRNGAPTDKYDREVAENDIRVFCH